MTLETIIGILAGTFTTLAVIPQIIKSWRSKKVMDVSPIMFSILILGVGLWVVYGILKGDIPIIVTNGISFILNFSMLVLMFLYKSES
ncbi:SemiSWEET transporter [Aequorivita sp. CIP111184]|uniref:SemiSWEET transporter n=1 Tax=Aequorivita sp. CIP111184 TaxID=2211356 RepID=UPI000DBC0D35|nr:SemiSWEET transporter [Aequorivita sp. CIP111184]SRX54299.1 Sugar transporter SemiSWEET [Aequorivita sp. CIP111184]